MNNGWIKLHRKILDNPKLQQDKDYFVVWVKILLLATHQERKSIFQGKEILLKPGQLITGRNFLARITQVNSSKVQRILNWLKSEHQIEQHPSNKNRLITIINWKEYQQVDNTPNNNRTTSEQQVNTYKNVKKEKNDKNIIYSEQSSQIQKVFDVFYNSINPNINYGNKTSRTSADWLIKKYGFEKTLGTAEYACSIQGNKYAPKITTPYQLKEKMADLMIYYKRNKSSGPTII